ncbi:dihydroxyacetone kinase subunit DhaK [Solirubrobacter ginsenosidimutans]|uniref:Dihydroxyacetone kinase subunit DhaK n=1 Tax=Solirubrobacter ginsenosidimutans TaxID=490573 RepID=A0A9X3N5M8_9ACTN|nr:dihydroxyacetone kinase subunit DhaK [Solirubrobacter ginsenosidimutans]MDA0165323.1 dihydroxyacetone kinase subunit DhaK [Solirubrobacter ginsenosidimutans]
MRRQFVNDPHDVVREALEGFARANAHLVRWDREGNFVARAQPAAAGKVGLLAGGGSGHEPLHGGFVGIGMLDAAVPGAIFSSPTAAQFEAATRAVDGGAGVLHILKNYTGDKLNAGIAAEIAAEDGIAIERVLVDDDLATDFEDDRSPGRRGTAAVIAVEKLCGAAAERGASLADLAALGRRVAEGSRSLALALSPLAHPGESRPSFELGDDEIEFGVGIHGERGIDRRPFAPADELARQLVEPVADALELGEGDQVAVIVNGLGATTNLELQVVFAEVARRLDARGVQTARALVGPYLTALDMAGCSVTLVRMDAETLALWDAPVRTPALTW